MNRFSKVALVSFLVAAGTVPALAQEDDWGWHMWGWGPGWSNGPGWGMMGPGMMGRMSAIDSNNDGVIGPDEAAAQVEAVFAVMDADDNGEITQEEYMSVRMGGGWGFNPERQAAMQKLKADRFSEMDPDKNGKVTQAEFIAAGEKRYAEADANKDGKVTPWEFRAMRWR